MGSKKKNIGVLGAFALSVGTGIGWGSFVVTGSNYLSKAGLLGSIIGIVCGMLLMFIIAYNYHYMIQQTPDSAGSFSFKPKKTLRILIISLIVSAILYILKAKLKEKRPSHNMR